MKQKILITRPLTLFPDVIERLSAYFDITVNEGEKYSPAGLKEALRDKSGVLLAGGEKVDAALVEGLTGLRAVCVSAAGYNSVEVGALTRAGIMVTNAPGPADETVADFAWGLLIATARKLTEAERWVRGGNWISSTGGLFFGTEVNGKTLGIIGMGRIGRAIARRGAGFRMKILYHNRYRLDESNERDCQATYMTKEGLLGASDFVLLALPYTTGNHHIIAAEDLRIMRPSAMLFNIARGGLIDEPALAEALSQHRLAAAGLDVFEGEPAIYPGLTELPNVVLAPHIAGATWEAQHGLTSLAADNLIAALGYGPAAGKPPSILNPEVLK
jgi:lactate dehydrogenase-like 2-hydroxyacid dehydrogenase